MPGQQPPPSPPRLSPLARRQWSWVDAAWLLLPLGAWLVATLYLGGDIGKSTDDYSATLRDPATGELPSPFNLWAMYPYFWRPLHILMCFGGGTLLDGHWRVLGVFCAVMHGVACLAVYAFLRLGTRSRGPAAAGALVLLVHPMNFEVAFWFLSISAAIATSLWCGLAVWCSRLVVRERRVRAIELGGIAVLALSIPCFYEQPATGVLALPLVLLGGWLGAARASRPSLRNAAVRALSLCGVAGAMNVVYIVLLRLTAPASSRGSAGSFVTTDRLLARVGEVAGSVRWQLYGHRLRETAAGAWEVGIETLATPVGIGAVGGLAILGVIWAWAWTVDVTSIAREEPSIRRGQVGARLCWTGAGIVLFLGGFIPIVLMGRQNVEPRTLYFPLVGVCLVVAQVLDLLLGPARVPGRSASWPARSLLAAIGLTTGGAVMAGSICCVGIQTWCQRRSQRDGTIAAELARLLPDAPAGIVFVPLRLDAGPSNTGRLLFDRLRPAAFSTTWSATAIMQQATHRADVTAASINPWADYPFDRFSKDGFWFDSRIDARALAPKGDGEFIAWAVAAPFVVSDDGEVRLVRQVEIERSDGRSETFVVPVVRDAVRAGDARGRATAIVLSDSADPPARTLTGWSWTPTSSDEPGGRVEFQPLTSRDMRREGIWLHPTYAAGTRRAIHATIEPPLGGAERAVRFHVTTPPEDYQRFAGAVPVTIIFDVLSGDGGGDTLLSTSLELTRDLAESEPRWNTITLSVPASDTVLTLRVSTKGAPGGPHAPVWVTPGVWITP